MKIPVIRASENLPQRPVTATMGGAGQTWDAVGRLSGVVQDITLDLAATQQRIRMARELSQAEIDIEVANKYIETKLRLKANPDTYVQDWATQFEGFAAKRLEGVKGVRTRAVMEQMFSNVAAREVTKQKEYANKLFLETEQSEVAKTLQGYAAEGNFKGGMKLIEDTKDLYGPKEFLKLKNDFTTLYDKTQNELADVAADQAIIKDPRQAVIDLQDNSYFPNLTPMQRQDKIEKAMAAAKVQDNEREQKTKEAIKASHDEEERVVGELYMKGEYSKAYTTALSSKSLTGDEKRTWADAIYQKTKTGDNIDSVVAANEIVKINAMISGEEDPNKIRNYVVQTPNLKKEDKEQYLNKLEAKLSSDENEGRKSGYSRIKDIIIPKRGILNPLTETPQETLNVRKAQDALDEWIDVQKKGKKYPTSTEIKAKADQLGNMYQIPLAQKMEEIETGAKNVASQMKGFAERKAIEDTYKSIPESDRMMVENKFRSSGYEPDKKSVVEAYQQLIQQRKTKEALDRLTEPLPGFGTAIE